MKLPKVSGRAFNPTADALCPGSKSSVFRRWRLLGLTSRCADMAVSWCTAVGSELARLRFSSRCSSSAGGVGGSCSSQEEIRVVFSVRMEGDTGGDVAIITCGAVGDRDSVLVLFICPNPVQSPIPPKRNVRRSSVDSTTPPLNHHLTSAASGTATPRPRQLFVPNPTTAVSTFSTSKSRPSQPYGRCGSAILPSVTKVLATFLQT